MTGDPLVSIRCTVYNHEPFLRQCLDGFVMQKTSFPFEAIVHDDASTDGSAAIIREYAEKYPDIIKPIYETENQYSKHDGSIGRIMDAAMHPSAKYIAHCEGDDYWTDPLKLQKQVDFLEAHPDFIMCSGNYRCYSQDEKHFKSDGRAIYDWLFMGDNENNTFFEYSLDNYFNDWWIRTLTCLYRRRNYRAEIINKGYNSFRDDILFYYILKHGNGALLRDVLGVYRLHSGGVWSNLDNISKVIKARENALEIYENERDKRAFKLIRRCTIQLLNFENEKKKTGFLKEELLSYYRIAPFDEFLFLLLNIVRNYLGRLYNTLFK